MVEKSLGVQGDEILYVGDHITYIQMLVNLKFIFGGAQH